MRRDTWLGWALIVIAGVAIVALRSSTVVPGPPLYDGVIAAEPYLWFDPPPRHPGGAEGATDTVKVEAGENHIVVVATAELPPQAQVIAQRGALLVEPDATTLSVSVTPVHATVKPADGYIDGNVYAFEITDQLGRPVSARAGAQATIVLRPADESLLEATIERFDGTAWVPLQTDGGGPFAFQAVVTEFGQFAVVAAGISPYPTPGETELPPPSTTGSETPAIPSADASTPAASQNGQPPPAPGHGIPPEILSIVEIAAGLIGLMALFLFYTRPRRRDD